MVNVVSSTLVNFLALSETSDNIVDALVMTPKANVYTVYLRRELKGMEKLRVYAVNIFQTSDGELLDHSNFLDLDRDMLFGCKDIKTKNNPETLRECHIIMKAFDYHMGIMFEVYFIPEQKNWFKNLFSIENKILQLRSQVFYRDQAEMLALQRKETYALIRNVIGSIITTVAYIFNKGLDKVIDVMKFVTRHPGTLVYGALGTVVATLSVMNYFKFKKLVQIF